MQEFTRRVLQCCKVGNANNLKLSWSEWKLNVSE